MLGPGSMRLGRRTSWRKMREVVNFIFGNYKHISSVSMVGFEHVNVCYDATMIVFFINFEYFPKAC